jgi:hypothetical protein
MSCVHGPNNISGCWNLTTSYWIWSRWIQLIKLSNVTVATIRPHKLPYEIWPPSKCTFIPTHPLTPHIPSRSTNMDPWPSDAAMGAWWCGVRAVNTTHQLSNVTVATIRPHKPPYEIWPPPNAHSSHPPTHTTHSIQVNKHEPMTVGCGHGYMVTWTHDS